MRRRKEPLDRTSLAGSLAVHAVVVLVAWLVSMKDPQPLEFVTYEIDLVSPPPAVQAEEAAPATEELVVERPEPEPPPEEPDPVVEEETPPPPEPDPEPTPAEPEPEEEETPAATTEEVEEQPTESGEDINVRMEGLRRDFPSYYENIIRQISRCFRWRGEGRWSTTLYFVITREGNAEDIRVAQSSGNVVFDTEAMGAVECAGRGRFGPLPEDLPYDRFPIRFRFDPSGGGGAVLAAP